MAVGDGVTGTHAPHVSPGNPGAPGVDNTAVYPAAQVPAHATPHVVYPTGQGVQVVALVAYCPGGQAGVEEGDTARLREPAGVRVTEPARVCVGVLVAPASSRCATRWEGVFDGDSVDLADRVGDRVAAPDRVGVRVLAGDLVGEREPEADLVEVPVALGDAVGDTTMQEPQVDGVNPTAQVPEKTGTQVAYPTGHAKGGVGDAVNTELSDEDDDMLNTGLPEIDAVTLDAALLEMDEVALDDGLPDTDDVADGLGVVVGDRNTATLRLVMVALSTPASLASQEYVESNAPLVMVLLGTRAVTLVYKKQEAVGGSPSADCRGPITARSLNAKEYASQTGASQHACRHKSSDGDGREIPGYHALPVSTPTKSVWGMIRYKALGQAEVGIAVAVGEALVTI